MDRKKVKIYTDGACSGNPGAGGWGAILCYKGIEKEFSGGENRTTNNRMELTGIISALEALKEPCHVELYSDSQYVVNSINKGWVRRWREKGWMRNKREKALNSDLWQQLMDLCEKHDVVFHWVRGHSENEWNNRCDELAVMERKKYGTEP